MGALYQISFPSGKSYIGVSKGDPRERFYRHAWSAKNGVPFALYKAMRKYGVENAVLRTLAIADWPYLLELEKRAIVAYGTKVPGGYNLTSGGDGVSGLSEESRKKISLAHLGTTRSAAQRAAVSAAQRGREHTPEHRAQAGAPHKGKPKSPESIAKRTATRRAKNGGAYFGR